MRQFLSHVTAFLLALGAGIATAGPIEAQNLFDPVVKVNDQVITRYELAQRTKMLQLLRAPGDPAKLAREQLIDDRLRQDAAKANGLTVPEETVIAGMEEFAGRANLTREQFIKALAAEGVAEQTFRDFVFAGVAWRELVRARFGPRVRVSDADVDRALAATTGASSVRILISEIIMPIEAGQEADVQARAAQISEITTIAGFAAQARAHSAASTAASGGRINWMPITNLPPALRPMILALAPGQVTDPVPLEGAIALFQLRAIEETDPPAPDYAAIDYATYMIPGGRSEAALAEAARITARVDTCDDLYGIAEGQPEEVLDRGAKKPADIPADIALELAKLDKGEVSTNLTRGDGQALMLLMLCGRTTALAEDASREDILVQLQNRQLESFANGYLAQLRADARIIEK